MRICVVRAWSGLAVRWRLAAGIKVVAVGDSVESTGVGAVLGADEGAGCFDCAWNDSGAFDGGQGFAGASPLV